MIFGFTSAVTAVGLVVLALAYVSFKRFTGHNLSKIRGPKSPSFVLGNLLEILQRPVGEAEFEWQRLYGDVVRIKSVLGASTANCMHTVSALTSKHPKAFHWIFHKSAYNYEKQANIRLMIRLLTGKGISCAVGEDHQRQRKVLLPGFGGPEAKRYLGIFQGCVEAISTKWMEIIGSSSDQKVVLNMSAWLSRATLDAIGRASFDVPFNAVDGDDDHPLVRTYNNMMLDMFGRPSAQNIFVQAASKHVPLRILEWMSDHSSNPRLKRAREVKRTATTVARDMVREKAENLLAGKGTRDIFSVLVKANMAAKNKLTEEELFSLVRTILVAGHETTASSLSWILLELARHPEVQRKLRSEIRKMEAAIRARGDTQFMVADIDAMPYTTAVVKEGLRYHPVTPHIHRVVAEDDVLPLLRPVTTTTGETISEIVVTKGTRVMASIAAYHRNTEFWGEDAHEFNPDRWLDGVASRKKPISVGAYSNLMTFTGGARGCLGYHIAVLEIQAFVVELVGKFEFAMTDQAARVSRQLSWMMFPMIDGELERGTQLPLAVSLAAAEEDVRA